MYLVIHIFIYLHCQLHIAFRLLPLACCLLPIAYCLLPIAYCLLSSGNAIATRAGQTHSLTSRPELVTETKDRPGNMQ